MPIYEYVCSECRASFEKLVRRWGEEVSCPSCQSGAVDKQISTFAVAASSSAGRAFEGCGRADGGCGASACGGGACGLPN
ncbi:MAG: zinc ribbon domain-containing protein [Vicinamibacteria bacterium]